MTGYVLLHRGWRECDVFMDEPMSEREAWLWLIENVAWKPMMRSNAKGERIRIERGQMHVSLRALEKVFGWGKNKVARFIQRLEDAEMLGTASGQSGTLITICNYSKYQDVRDSRDSETGTAAGQLRDTQEEGIRNNTISEANASSIVPEPAPLPPVQEALQVWNVEAQACGWPLVAKLNDTRRRSLAARLREHKLDGWQNALSRARSSPYLGGDPPTWFTFDWITKPTNFLKLIEGNYDRRHEDHRAGNGRGPEPDPVLDIVRAATAAQRQDGGDYWEARPALPARQYG